MILFMILTVLPVIECGYVPEVRICQQDGGIADCSNAELTNIPETVDRNVTSLELSRNKFENIPRALKHFQNLRYLNFSHNKISTLGYADFTGLENLETLDLRFNLFHDWKDIVAETFKPLKKLMFLDLSSNPFGTLSKYSNHFDLKSLEILKLENCSLINIYPEVFESATSLKELYLTRNPVQVINGSFHLKQLKLLDISNCRLHYLNPNAVINANSLEILSLNNNKYLRKLILNSPSILTLNLSDCNLESVPYGSLENLIDMRLDRNFLKHINQNSFAHFLNLINLNLSVNAINSINENSFRGLNNLKKMDLQENKITYISEKLFLPTIVLEELNLSHNYIKSIDNITSSSIKTLDVSYCEIYIVSVFSLINLPKLKKLSLSRNFLSYIPDRWTADRLIYLDLSRCRIRTINNRTFEKMINLKTIDLSGNQLTSVEINNFIGAFTVHLEDNPWQCDCSKLEELYLWLIALDSLTDDLVCDSPAKSQGLTWEQACDKEWNMNRNKTKQIWWYSVVVIVAMGLLLAAVIMLKRLNDMRENRLRQQEEQRNLQERQAREALARMQRLQREFIEEADRNAPDPRESQRPPSYTDALLLPRLDASHPSLAGSKHSIGDSNSSLNKKGRQRRKRRKRRSERSEDDKRQSRVSVDDSDTSNGDRPSNRLPLESDF